MHTVEDRLSCHGHSKSPGFKLYPVDHSPYKNTLWLHVLVRNLTFQSISESSCPNVRYKVHLHIFCSFNKRNNFCGFRFASSSAMGFTLTDRNLLLLEKFFPLRRQAKLKMIKLPSQHNYVTIYLNKGCKVYCRTCRVMIIAIL